MKRSKKITIIVAVILVAVGLIIALGALTAMDFDFTKLNTVNFVTNTYSVGQAFDGISVKGAECDLRLMLSDDGLCKVECNERDKIAHSVTVKDNTLIIERFDSRKWYERIGIYWGRMEIVLYLPQSEYELIYAESLSGNIELSDIECQHVNVESTSGDINFFKVYAAESINIKSVSGGVEMNECDAGAIGIKTTGGKCEIKTTSGDVSIEVKGHEKV